MTIGILSIELSIVYNETIKERRNVLRSLKDMVRKRFNVSIAEIQEGKEITNRATIGIAAVSGDTSHLQSTLANIMNLIENFYPDIILSYKTDFLYYE